MNNVKKQIKAGRERVSEREGDEETDRKRHK